MILLVEYRCFSEDAGSSSEHVIDKVGRWLQTQQIYHSLSLSRSVSLFPPLFLSLSIYLSGRMYYPSKNTIFVVQNDQIHLTPDSCN